MVGGRNGCLQAARLPADRSPPSLAAAPCPPTLQVELHVTAIRCISRSAALPFEVTDAARSAAAVRKAAEAGELLVTVNQVGGFVCGFWCVAVGRSQTGSVDGLGACAAPVTHPPTQTQLLTGHSPGQPLRRPAHPRQPGHLPHPVSGLPGGRLRGGDWLAGRNTWLSSSGTGSAVHRRVARQELN